MRYSFHQKREQGSAMLIAIILLTVGFLTLLGVTQLAGENFKRTDGFIASEQAFYAATGGTEYVASDIWARFDFKRNGDGNYDFRYFLDNVLAFGGGYHLAAGSTLEVTDYNNKRMGNAVISRVRLTRTDYADPVNTNTVHTDLLVEVEAATDQGQSVWASRILGSTNKLPFAGLEYAVLTKNITCSLCHMRVQSLNKSLNRNSAYYGQYNKIRVGTTELLAMRADSAETVVEGALYHRGRIEDEGSGNALDYATVTGSHVKTVTQDTSKGTVKQDASTGAVDVTNLASTGVIDTATYRTTNHLDDDGDGIVDEADEGSANRNRDGVDNDGDGVADNPDEVVLFDPKGNRRVDPTTGVPYKNDSLYLEYPKVKGQMDRSDGELPVDQIANKYDPSQDIKAFPEPFKDPNKNRKIDTSEIDEQVLSATNPAGTAPGTISTAIGLRMAPGEVYGGGTMPNSAGSSVKIGASKSANYTSYTNRTASGVSLSGNTANQGNYVLTGTATDPIMLNGKVVIQGDVIVQGYVQGEGQIYATGNIYIPNDIKYKNRVDSSNNAVFGESNVPDGVGGYKRNLLGITSGGTIVVGDYLSTVTHWNSGNDKFYDYGMPEAGQKLDRAKMPSLPDTGSLSNMGGDANSVNTVNVNFANFVMEELSFFNQNELAKVTKTSKSSDNTNDANAWQQDNRYDPVSNPNGMWRVPPGPLATATTSYVPRFYRMYGDFPTPADADPTLNYGKSYSGGASDPVVQDQLQNSSIPFYINRGSTWQTSKGYYNNTGDPHTYNSIAEMKLNLVAGKYTYDAGFYAGGDPLSINPTLGVQAGSNNSSGSDNRIPASVLDTTAIGNSRIINIHPDWITPTNMLNLILSEEKNRNSLSDSTGLGVPRQIDGLLYTNNSIFMIERKQTQTNNGTYDPSTGKWSGTWTKTPTKSRGSFIVNGAIIAPDLGVLVTGGTNTTGSDQPGFTPTTRSGSFNRERQAFTVNYDPRVKDLLNGIGDSNYWNTERKGWGRAMGKMP